MRVDRAVPVAARASAMEVTALIAEVGVLRSQLTLALANSQRLEAKAEYLALVRCQVEKAARERVEKAALHMERRVLTLELKVREQRADWEEYNARRGLRKRYRDEGDSDPTPQQPDASPTAAAGAAGEGTPADAAGGARSMGTGMPA